MFRTLVAIAVLATAGILVGCGTSTTEPNGGSWHTADTGVSSSGYPAGNPRDAESPALASSTESRYSRDQEVKEQPDELNKK